MVSWVSLYTVSGECHVNVKVIDRTILTNLVFVDVNKQFPLATQLVAEFADVFKDELGVLKDIEATITVTALATPCFHKS